MYEPNGLLANLGDAAVGTGGLTLASIGEALLIPFAIALGILAIIFIAVPIFKGVGWAIGSIFQGIGWLIAHVFNFIFGMIGDAVRFVGTIISMVLFVPLVLLCVLFGRWSAAGHFASAVKREFKVAGLCLYRVALQRPLRFLLLHGLLEGVEQRVPEAMARAPKADKPKRRTGQFDGYTIVGSLPGGGSGGKLYVAKPDKNKRIDGRPLPPAVVIKSFALTEGSSLPQIVRESRALECAKSLGLVLEHGMDEHRFFYIMPYHEGDHLGIITKQLHGESDGRGLSAKQIDRVLGYMTDLVATLTTYHHGGLWHKDVKPENVIVHDGRAHLVDLGLVTPLRSAMTLTTHGTEYFRDPEMVRQALRGVKVHQVNGVKFDIYAVGAVLYYVLENTFPAHGGLSRFSRKSPEAMRWIVKRAMAEYHQRYETADELLADLAHVAESRDAFAVKAAELPSMRGREAVAQFDASEYVPPEAEVAAVHAAGSPLPNHDADADDAEKKHVYAYGMAGAHAFGIAAGKGGVHVGRFDVDEHGNPIPRKAKKKVRAERGRRPNIEVTNWWTGEYRVHDESPGARYAAQMKEQARVWRHEAQKAASQVRAGTVSARKAAREQVKAAKQRAAEMRRSAQSHRKAMNDVREPKQQAGPVVASIVIVFLIFVGLAMFKWAVNDPDFSVSVNGSNVSVSRGGNSATVGAHDPGRPVLIVPADEMLIDEYNVRYLEDIHKKYRSQYHLVMGDKEMRDELRGLYLSWNRNHQRGAADRVLEDALEDHNLFGILYVNEGENGHLVESVITSTRRGAKQRRWDSVGSIITTPDIAVGVPFSEAPDARPGRHIFINDHPAKANEQVQSHIAAYLTDLQHKGWDIVEDFDDETQIRSYLSLADIDTDAPPSSLLIGKLQELELDGIWLIRATPGTGDEQTHERIQAVHISADAPSGVSHAANAADETPVAKAA